jgi:hypothetical protein
MSCYFNCLSSQSFFHPIFGGVMVTAYLSIDKPKEGKFRGTCWAESTLLVFTVPTQLNGQ